MTKPVHVRHAVMVRARLDLPGRLEALQRQLRASGYMMAFIVSEYVHCRLRSGGGMALPPESTNYLAPMTQAVTEWEDAHGLTIGEVLFLLAEHQKHLAEQMIRKERGQ